MLKILPVYKKNASKDSAEIQFGCRFSKKIGLGLILFKTCL